jgi:hypothetical protein
MSKKADKMDLRSIHVNEEKATHPEEQLADRC